VTARDEEASATEDDEEEEEEEEDNEDDEGALRRDMYILQHWGEKGSFKTGEC
jgi:hypothetical protein